MLFELRKEVLCIFDIVLVAQESLEKGVIRVTGLVTRLILKSRKSLEHLSNK